MKIIIDIPNEIRRGLFDGVYCGIRDKRVSEAIKRGIPLDGNGRLIDADELLYHLADYRLQKAPYWGASRCGNIDAYVAITNCMHAVERAQTVIEADEVVENAVD